VKKLLRTAASLAVLAASGAASADDRAGAALLFSEGAGGLTEAEQSAIFARLDLTVAPDGKSLVDRSCGQPAGSDVQFSDWNADGKKEVLVTYGNTCTSGMAGSSVVLFVKDASGKYQPQLGFPGMVAEVLPAKHEGYPELLIGGPGFCFAAWRWDGKAYVHARNEPQSPGGCDEAKP
jgi:hypothetical protein